MERRDEAGLLLMPERCADCRIPLLDAAMEGDRGRQLLRAIELMDAHELLGATCRLVDVTNADLEAARSIRAARQRKQDERALAEAARARR